MASLHQEALELVEEDVALGFADVEKPDMGRADVAERRATDRAPCGLNLPAATR